MRYPKHIDTNATIGFVAPSCGCATEPYYTAFGNAQEKFKALGHRLALGPNCYADKGIGISNLPQACAQELMEYYASQDCDCLIACGGGELMCEILPCLDFDRLAKLPPKWYMGYSDNTNFTYLMATICDTASIYGPCAGTFGMQKWHASIRDAYGLLLAPEERPGQFTVKNYDGWEKESLKDEQHPLEPYHITEPFCMRRYVGTQEIGKGEGREIAFSGRLIGGCLDCLGTLLGTRFDHTKAFLERYREDGIIWFLEACDMNVFSIRRTLWQMQQAGWFPYVKGFLIGRPRIAEEMMGLDAYQAVIGVLGEYGVPVLLDLDIGHVAPMMPLIVGSYATVTAGEDTITIQMEEK